MKQWANVQTLPLEAKRLMLTVLESILAESSDPAFARAAEPLVAALDPSRPPVAVEAAA